MYIDFSILEEKKDEECNHDCNTELLKISNSIRCEGYWSHTPNGDEFDCGYEAEINCEDCICNYQKLGGIMSPETNKPVTNKEIESFEELNDKLKNLPETWYPQLIKTLVRASQEKGVWKDGGCAKFIGRIESNSI